jgi:hypothetical protein
MISQSTWLAPVHPRLRGENTTWKSGVSAFT